MKGTENLPLGELTLGSVLSAMLGKTKSSDDRKSYVLSLRFASEEKVTIDAADVSFVKKVVETSDYVPLVKGQVLISLDGLTEDKKA